MSDFKIAVIIPCFRVRAHILNVISAIGPEVRAIYVVDDQCPEQTGNHVEKNANDPRLTVLRNDKNVGVGGAVVRGYEAAIADGFDVLVKLDGDGQMNPALISELVKPILLGEADYAKGNRFFNLDGLGAMPPVRIIGNAMLSLLAKLSTGYWDIFDPTNGFTAIHTSVAHQLPFEKISRRYFFESDMLFRLNLLRAVVVDIPMDACYGDETSNLKITRVVGEFLVKHLRNLTKRIFYNYFLRDMSLASIELLLGLLLLVMGATFGIWSWATSVHQGIFTPAGTVMLAALPILIGLQLILAFLAYDIAAVPRSAIHKRLSGLRPKIQTHMS